MLLHQLHRRDDIVMTLLRRFGRANLVDRILAGVFACAALQLRTTGMVACF